MNSNALNCSMMLDCMHSSFSWHVSLFLPTAEECKKVVLNPCMSVISFLLPKVEAEPRLRVVKQYLENRSNLTGFYPSIQYVINFL